MSSIRVRGLFLVAGLLWASAAWSGRLPGPLVETDWLAAHMDDVVVLSVRADVASFTAKPVIRKDKKGRRQLLRVAGHIPGARLLDYRKARTKRKVDGKIIDKIIPPRPLFEGFMQSLGVDTDSAIVLVSKGLGSGDMTMATRVYWQLKYYGHDDVAILDGGLSRWLLEGREFSTTPSRPGRGDWTARAERRELLATTEDVEKALQTGDRVLIDNRPLSQYMGVYKKSYVYAKGHIPGAKPYPNELMTGPGPGARFLPGDELRALMEGIGIDPERPAIAYCNSGHLASGGWFILHELLGNERASLYDGSMHEWTLEKRPVKAFRLE